MDLSIKEPQQHIRIGSDWTMILKVGSGEQARDLLFVHDDPEQPMLYAQAVLDRQGGLSPRFTLVEISPESELGKEMQELMGEEMGPWEIMSTRHIFVRAWALSHLSETINRMERIFRAQEIVSGEKIHPDVLKSIQMQAQHEIRTEMKARKTQAAA